VALAAPQEVKPHDEVIWLFELVELLFPVARTPVPVMAPEQEIPTWSLF